MVSSLPISHTLPSSPTPASGILSRELTCHNVPDCRWKRFSVGHVMTYCLASVGNWHPIRSVRSTPEPFREIIFLVAILDTWRVTRNLESLNRKIMIVNRNQWQPSEVSSLPAEVCSLKLGHTTIWELCTCYLTILSHHIDYVPHIHCRNNSKQLCSTTSSMLELARSGAP